LNAAKKAPPLAMPQREGSLFRKLTRASLP
jgi:hypothetical protein